MIVGIGLDSNEVDRPPLMFQKVFTLAKQDGFRITAHCDVGKQFPTEHIHQVAFELGGTGADRIDHGLNAVLEPELVQRLCERHYCMTVCPYSYVRHEPFEEVFARIKYLFDFGICISINSDDPALMEDTWVHESLLLVKKYCQFSNEEVKQLIVNAVKMSWTTRTVKDGILRELHGIASDV